MFPLFGFNQVKTDKPLTICIIKPDMIAQGKKDEIIEKIKQKGYEIVEQKDVKFTEEMARSFYKHQENSVSLIYLFIFNILYDSITNQFKQTFQSLNFKIS